MNDKDFNHLYTVLGPGNFRSIAKRTKLAPQHVARVLKGMKGANLDTAVKIAKAAGVSLDSLVAFRDEMTARRRPQAA